MRSIIKALAPQSLGVGKIYYLNARALIHIHSSFIILQVIPFRIFFRQQSKSRAYGKNGSVSQEFEKGAGTIHPS